MLQLSKRVEYALIALLHLDALPEDELVTTKEIAGLYHAPSELQAKVLQSLARNNILESVQGARGGYRLARPLEEMTLGHVIEAVDGPIVLVRCQEDPASCDQFCTCNIREPVERVQTQLRKFINQIELTSFRRSEHRSTEHIQIT